MIGDTAASVADKALGICGELGDQARAANSLASDALRIGQEAVELLKSSRSEATKLAGYFELMASANDHEPMPGNVPYTGAAAFRHAAELVAKLARGEKII